MNHDEIGSIADRPERVADRILAPCSPRHDTYRLDRRTKILRRICREIGRKRHHELVDRRVPCEERHAPFEHRSAADGHELLAGAAAISLAAPRCDDDR